MIGRENVEGNEAKTKQSRGKQRKPDRINSIQFNSMKRKMKMKDIKGGCVSEDENDTRLT
jgi:hypothetical protein